MPRQAAVREVAEECGIPAPRIIAPLPPTYHTYTQAGKKILKKTYWYTMQHTGSSALVPQTEEGITQVFWVNKADVPQYYTKMYAALVPLLQNVVDTMP
jgi:8-oxo-dGTP pyrophosphatase MutT (NUDIX family)